MGAAREVGLGIADGEGLGAVDAAQLAKALDAAALVEAGGHDVEGATGTVLAEVEGGGLGHVGEIAVVAPHETEPGDVDHRLCLIVRHLAAHADGDLAVLDAVGHVVVVLDAPRPAIDDAWHTPARSMT